MTTPARLNKGQEPMSEEKWAQHKDCETAPREHKWQWKNDIQSGMPHPYLAICVHCGVERTITRKTDEPRGVSP